MTDALQNPAPGRAFEEFSPRKMIILAQQGGRYLLSKWIVILLAALVGGIGGVLYSSFKKPLYTAEISFALDEEAAPNPRSGISILNEQLGIGPASDAGSIFGSMTNIVELMQSRLLIERTLRRTVTVNDRPLVLGNFFLDSLKFREKWMKSLIGHPYYNKTFLLNSNDPRVLLLESRMLGNMYQYLEGTCLKIERKGKGTTILSVICSTQHELFTKYFLEALLDETTNYYIETRTSRARLNLALIQKRTDSVRNAYNAALSGRAEYSDAHSSPSRQIAFVSRERQQTDIDILRNNYTELMRTQESSRTALMRETPLIQYIDLPILPLAVKRSDTVKLALIFALVGAFLAIAYFLLTKTYRYILLH